MIASGVRLSDKTVNFVPSGRQIRPLRDQLIVRPLPLALGERVQADWQGEPVRGVVIAAGPGVFPNIHSRFRKDGKEVRQVRESKQFRPTEVKPGDVVQLGGLEIQGYLWPRVWADGDWCVICREADVCLIECPD